MRLNFWPNSMTTLVIVIQAMAYPQNEKMNNNQSMAEVEHLIYQLEHQTKGT